MVRTENAHQLFGKENDHAPHHRCIKKDHHTHGEDRTAHMPGSAGPIIIANNRRRPFCQCIDRRLYHLTYTGYDCHYGYVYIATGYRQYVIAADRYQAVGKLHNKASGSKTDNIFAISYAS